MDYIVLDLEWNQSGDGKENEVPGFPFEIIEIGAIKLNSEKEMIDEFTQLIKPQVYHQMNHITKKLIHLQIEELVNGNLFPDALRDFLEWCKSDYIFCTWGPLDLSELQRNMEYYHLNQLSNGPLKFYDVQKLFSIAFEDKKVRRALEYAVDFLDIKKDIPFHRAFSDAYYTAKVFAKINDPLVMEKVSYDVYIVPKRKEDEVHIVFDDYSKYISREFKDKIAAMDDKEVISVKCYLCNKAVKKKIRWFSSNGKHYYCVAYCDKHGFVKGKIRMKKSENEKVYVIKTIKIILEDEIEGIKIKQEKARIQRQIKRQQKKQ